MLRARALEQALRMLIDAAVQTACKIAEDGDRRWHVVDLVCATNDAEKLLAVDTPPSGASSVDAPIYRQVYIVTHYSEGGLRGVHASQAGAEAEIAELCREYPDYTRQDFSIVCDRIRPSPPSGASPQATGGYIHHSLTDWIPTPGCDCDRCTSARKSAPKPTGGASPQAETSEDEDDAPAVDSWSAPLRKPVVPKILSTDDFYALLRILEVLPVADPFLTDLQAKLSDEERRQHGNRASHLSGPEFVREIERIEALIQSRLPAPVSPVEPTGASPQAETRDYIDIVFDGPPSPESGRFIEAEDAQGASISVGQWVQRPDGYWALRLPAPVSPVEPTVNRALREANDCLAAIRARLWEVLNGRDLGGDRSLLGMVNMLIGQRDEARENRRGETCEWRYNADAERWQSGCDSQDLSGDERLVGPDEKAKFCPYCGKPLRLVPSEEPK